MSVLVFDSVTDELQHLADSAGSTCDQEGKQLYLRYLGHIRQLEAKEKVVWLNSRFASPRIDLVEGAAGCKLHQVRFSHGI